MPPPSATLAFVQPHLVERYRRARSLALAVVVATLAIGCGAKTGLDVPDASRDAGIDAPIDADIPCIEVPLDGGPIEVPLETEVELGRADVVFLVDTTASMQDEINRIREQLRDRIAPAVNDAIPDAQFAVAIFADFPEEPFGDREEDTPFSLVLPLTDELTRVQSAFNSIELGNGRDSPESQVEALYQLATGAGIGDYVEPSLGCPSGGTGYPCFRDDALPIVLLFTDAPFHNGPGGSEPYSSLVSPPPHTYEDAIRELTAIGARVIGFDSGDGEASRDLRATATDTDTLGTDGQPIVFDIGSRGERLGTGVIDAMRTFASSVLFDIDAVLGDPDPGDGVDPTEFVEAIDPLRAEPMDGIDFIDFEAGVFRGVKSGTTVVFQIRLRNDAVVPGPEPRRFRLEVTFRGDGRTHIARRIVEIVVPGEDGEGCDEPLPPGTIDIGE